MANESVSSISSSVIQVKELTHAYNSYLAVDHLSFSIEAGKTFGLIGPNGAGKSTTIKMLTTLLPVTSGTALINGYDLIKQPSQIRQSVGYVPQLLSADGDLTGYENLLLSAKLYGLSFEVREQRIRDILNFMELSPFSERLMNTYSGGMIRRLEIAQALLHQPSRLLSKLNFEVYILSS
jgi:ABC-2 type transport system ATP-binding protein